MSLSASMSKVAGKLIKKFGVECTFTHETETAFDPAQGIKTKTTTEFEAYGVKDAYTKEEINGTTILSSDIKLVMENVGDIPVVDDTCAINGTSYRVMNVTPVDPDDVVIIYEIQLRV